MKPMVFRDPFIGLEVVHEFESCWRTSEAGRQRKYYALKGHGRKALQAQKAQWQVVHGALAKLWGV